MSQPITNLEMERGTTFSISVTLTDINSVAVNVSGYAGIMQLRVDSGRPKIEPVYTLTTENGRITTPIPANGTFVLTIPASDSVIFPVDILYYDFIITDTLGEVSKILKGSFKINQSVSV